MPKLKTLEDYLIDSLKDLYSAEKQLTRALPRMAKKASSEKLKEALEDHFRETEAQVQRLEEISKLTGGKQLTGKKSKAMEGLIEEGMEVVDEDCSPEVRDVAIIAAAQKIEHYEIAAYGCSKTYARLLGNIEVEDLLSESEREEAAADGMLTALSEEINEGALQPAENN